MFYGNLALQEQYREFEIPADELNRLLESINNSYNYNYLIEGKFLDTIEKAARGLANYYTVNFKEVYNCAKDIFHIIKTEGITIKSDQECTVRINQLFYNIGNNLSLNKNIKDDIDKKLFESSKENIAAGFNLTMHCLIGNMITDVICNFLFGPIVGEFISTVYICPLREENAKQLAIKGKFTKEFTIIFNIVEFSLYMKIYTRKIVLPDGKVIVVSSKMLFSNIASYKRYVANLAVVRGFGVLFHLTTTAIQWLTNNKKVRQLLGLQEDNEITKAQLAIIGKSIGFMMHILNNAGITSGFYEKILYRGLTKVSKS